MKEVLTTVDCFQYSGHSFRRGTATTAEKQGISDATIKCSAGGRAVLIISCISRPFESSLQPTQDTLETSHSTGQLHFAQLLVVH